VATTRVSKGFERPIAVFDLDGTLLDGDSTGHWMMGLLLRSFWRTSFATLIAPLASSMLLFPKLRMKGASLFLWIATAGMDEAALRHSVYEFVQRFDARRAKLAFRPGALDVLERHLSEGHHVAVVTAAPAMLATALLNRWASRITVFGSSLKRTAGAGSASATAAATRSAVFWKSTAIRANGISSTPTATTTIPCLSVLSVLFLSTPALKP